MNEARAREILAGWIEPDNRLRSMVPWVQWYGGDSIGLDDRDFTVEQLEAAAWWMRNMKIMLKRIGGNMLVACDCGAAAGEPCRPTCFPR